MSRYLPEEIIGDILPRLPAKSVLRFRCVCKSWLKLFRNPNFIKRHLKYAKQRNSTNLLLSGADKCMYASRDIDSSSTTCSFDVLFRSSLHMFLCLGSCNGLVCFDVGDAVICILNPTTNESKRISKPESCYSSKIKGNSKKWPLVCGLGYDSNSDDYKFLMLSYSYTTDHGSFSVSAEVNVYSLRSNSWKIIEHNLSCFLATIQYAGVFLNGFLHWVGFYMTFNEIGVPMCHDDILTFDFCNETFNLDLRKPKDLDRYSSPKLVIGVLGDSLCMSFDNIRGSERCLDVWVMRDYGVRESWTKLFTVVTNVLLADELPVIPKHILKNGEILLARGDGGQKTLYVYDADLKSARVLEFSGVPKWLGIVTYLESLVSPNLGDSTGPEEYLQEQ